MDPSLVTALDAARIDFKKISDLMFEMILKNGSRKLCVTKVHTDWQNAWTRLSDLEQRVADSKKCYVFDSYPEPQSCILRIFPGEASCTTADLAVTSETAQLRK
jgi:hypothetical protein